MAPKEPRDRDRRLPSQGGIPVEIDPETTPVNMPPLESIELRQRKQANTLSAIREEIRTTAARSEAEDKRLTANLNTLDGKIERVSGHVADLRESNARAETKLDLIHIDVQAAKRVAEHREKTTIETQAIVQRVTIEDEADEKKQRRARNVRIIAIIGAATTALTTALTALLSKC